MNLRPWHPCALALGLLTAGVLAPAEAAQKPAAGSTAAATPERKPLGTFKDWSAYSDGSGKKKICYVGAKPQDQDGKIAGRERAYFLVTHRPAGKVVAEVSVEAGFTYKDGTDAEAVVDNGKPFKLFTKGGNAWTRDAATDRALVAAMKGGRRLVLKGTPSKGPPITNTYALAGFGQALTAINKACDVH